MRWTAWRSIAVVSLAVASYSGGASGQPMSNNSDRAAVKEVVTTQEVAATQSEECDQLGSFFSELLVLTNKAREDAGVGELQFSYQLGQSAQNYAEDLATQNFFSHTGKDGSSSRGRIAATGYQYVATGENLAAGQSSANSVFQGWMSSDVHRSNILREDFTEVGFGLFDATGRSDYGFYWVQNFGKPRNGRTRSDIYIPDSCRLSVSSIDQASKAVVAGATAPLDSAKRTFAI
ncbi:MAG: CAP domain-containing protein [Phormidesmis sp.]